SHRPGPHRTRSRRRSAGATLRASRRRSRIRPVERTAIGADPISEFPSASFDHWKTTDPQEADESGEHVPQCPPESRCVRCWPEDEYTPHDPLCSATSNCTLCWPEDSADLGSEDIEDEYVDPREEYADAVCIPLRGEIK